MVDMQNIVDTTIGLNIILLDFKWLYLTTQKYIQTGDND